MLLLKSSRHFVTLGLLPSPMMSTLQPLRVHAHAQHCPRAPTPVQRPMRTSALLCLCPYVAPQLCNAHQPHSMHTAMLSLFQWPHGSAQRPCAPLLLYAMAQWPSQLSHSPMLPQCQSCPSTCAWCLSGGGVFIICNVVAL